MAFDFNSYKKEYDKQHYDNIMLRVPKGKKEILAEYAKREGETLPSLIIKAIESYTFISLKRDKDE